MNVRLRPMKWLKNNRCNSEKEREKWGREGKKEGGREEGRGCVQIFLKRGH